MKKILLVEDNETIVMGLSYSLEQEGFEIVSSKTRKDAEKILESETINLVLLDVTLPDGNGFDICKYVKQKLDIPVIFLTAQDEETSVVVGLDLGADDYLTKPFNPLEVVARVKSLLRRCYEFKLDNVEESKKILKVGELVLNEETVSLTKNGEEIQLTPTEFKILALLMSNPGRVYTKVQIYENINGEYFKNDDGALMVHIYRIREKVEDDSKNPMYLKTVRGLGYKIEKI